MPQIFMRTMGHPKDRKNRFLASLAMTWLGRYSKQSGESQSGFWSKHELLADEEGIEAGGAKFLQFIVGAEAGFAYAMQPSGMRSIKSNEVCTRTSRVLRSRLLTR
jgi:hypothetical protein